jgi:hypothetical protein
MFREETMSVLGDEDSSSYERMKLWMAKHFDFHYDIYGGIS